MKQRILNLLIALDQLAWVIVTLGKGSPDETISAALWCMEQQGKISGRVARPRKSGELSKRRALNLRHRQATFD